MSEKLSRIVAAIVVASALFVSTAITAAKTTSGEVLHVPRDYPTIQSAVNAAAAGDTIQVSGGLYNENVLVATPGLRLHASGGAVLDGSGLTGTGIYVRGSAAALLDGVEISGFEVRNFERGIIVQWAVNARVFHNAVHHNLDKTAPLALGDAAGIELITSHFNDVSQNDVHHNGDAGVQLRVGSMQNLVRGNQVYENGTQRMADLEGRGILATGAGTHDNRIEHNNVSNNFGRGIMISRPLGTAPITGNLVAHNQAHGNWRSGIAIMAAATRNTVVHNDARDNNLSGLAPCYRCNLFDNSIGGNIWEKNHGTFNGSDACAP
jgi:parallel beta-helix repeat protein